LTARPIYDDSYEPSTTTQLSPLSPCGSHRCHSPKPRGQNVYDFGVQRRLRVISAITANVLLFSLAVFPATASPTRDQVPVIAIEGEKGVASVFVYLGGYESSPSSIPTSRSSSVSIKACDGTDCETFNMNSFIDIEGMTGHKWLWGSVTIGERFGKKPVTLAAPIDITDASKGYSTASNPVTGWADPNTYYRNVKDKPFAQMVYQTLTATSIGKVDMCLNFSADRNFVIGVDKQLSYDLGTTSHLFYDTSGYSSATYSILEDGKPFKNGVLPAASMGPTGPPSTSGIGIPMCGSGTLGSSLMSSFDGLSAGKSYSISYTVSGAAVADITGSLTFITPTGCPTGDPQSISSPRPFNFAVISPDNIFQSVILVGNSWKLDSLIGKSLAPIYLSGNKTQPFRGRFGPKDFATTTEKWKYVKEIDDWAQVLEAATPLTASQVLAQTLYSGCTPSQVKVALSVDTSTIPQSDQGCTVTDGQVVPTGQKVCVLTAKVERQGVTTSGIRKKATPASLLVAYSITSLGTFSLQSSTTTSAPVASSTVPPVSIAKPILRAKVQKSKTLTANSLAKSGKMVVAKTDKITMRISSGSKYCRVVRTKLLGLKKGTCKVTITKTSTKKKTTRASVSVTVK
jgi:hypothetical protein